MTAFIVPFVLFLPLFHFTPVPGLPGFLPISYFLTGILIFAILMLRWKFFIHKLRGRFLKIDLLVSALVFAQLPSLITSMDTRISIKVLYQWAVALLLYFFICRFCTDRDIRNFYRGICSIVFLAAAVVAFQYIANSTWPVTPYLDEVLEEERLNLGMSNAKTVGIFLHANSQSLMFTILIPMVIGYGISSKQGSSDRIFAFIAFILGIGAELLTLSRAGISILMLTLILMSIVTFKEKSKFSIGSKKRSIMSFLFSPGILFMLVGSLLIFASGLIDPVVDRFTSSDHSERDEGSNYARIVNLTAGINATMAHPMFGIGPGLSPKVYYQFGGWEGFGAHNAYISLSSESGILVALLYIILLCIFLKKVLKYHKFFLRRGQSRLALKVGCFGALVSIVLNGLFETVMADIFICIVFVVFALTARLSTASTIQRSFRRNEIFLVGECGKRNPA